MFTAKKNRAVKRAAYKDASINKAVYTAFVAPRRPKSESITYRRTDGPTDGRTDGRTDGHTLL